jgi:thermostable 8-oxoguanine DNA glycosylase
LDLARNTETVARLDEVRLDSSPQTERKAADFLDKNLRGFGPKQSRNLLQWLGLSRYEIPIDSRLTKWLNGFGFPVKLNAFCLADPIYYNFVSDGFQRLCEVCDIVPCVLDAAIFASFDGDQWTDENV